MLDESLAEHLEHLASIDLTPNDSRSAKISLEEVLKRMEQRHLRETQEGLLISEGPSYPPTRKVEESIVSLNARLKELFSQNTGAKRG